MNIKEAIKYLILLADRYHSKGHGEYEPDGDFLIGVTKLLKRLPQTKDGFHVLPGDSLEPCKDVDYLCGRVGEPEVVMQVHYILESGQHVTDGVYNFNRGKDEEV